MFQYQTIGRNYYPGLLLPIWHSAEAPLEVPQPPDRFRLMLMRSGTGILRLEERCLTVMAPCVLCLMIGRMIPPTALSLPGWSGVSTGREREIESHQQKIDELACRLYGIDELPDAG